MSTSTNASFCEIVSTLRTPVSGGLDTAVLRQLLNGTVHLEDIRLAAKALAGRDGLDLLCGLASQISNPDPPECLADDEVVRLKIRALTSWDLDFIAKLRASGSPGDAAAADAMVAASL